MCKKFIFFVLVLFAFGTISLGQNFEGGLILGMDATQISGDNLMGFNKLGLTFGGFTSLKLNGKSKLKLEIVYIQKGSRTNFTFPFIKDSIQPYDNTQKNKYYLSLHYIEIPFLYLYEYKKKITLEGGLSVGTFISSYEEYDYLQLSHPDDMPNFYPFDFSFAFGFYYKLSDKFQLNGRFSNSFLPVRPHKSNATYRMNMGQYNCVLQLTLNYKIK